MLLIMTLWRYEDVTLSQEIDKLRLSTTAYFSTKVPFFFIIILFAYDCFVSIYHHFFQTFAENSVITGTRFTYIHFISPSGIDVPLLTDGEITTGGISFRISYDGAESVFAFTVSPSVFSVVANQNQYLLFFQL